MGKSRFTEEQIINVLRKQESGAIISDLCRKYGISEQTFYRWKHKFGGMSISEIRRLKTLEEENQHLKQIVGQQLLDIMGLKEALKKHE